MPNLARHVLWLYGIIAGLAIREGLSRVVPILLHPFDVPVQASENNWTVAVEGARLLILLILTTRFYFGAASFFEEEHAHNTPIQNRNVTLDLGVGLFHFISVFAWSLTVNVHDDVFPGLTPFAALLAWILLYDLWWWLLCGKYDTSGRVLKWATLNFLTALFCALGYVPLMIKRHPVLAEMWLMVTVIPFSLIDIAEVVKQEALYLSGAEKVLGWFHGRLSSFRVKIDKARGR